MTGGTLWLKCKDLRILRLDVIGADQFAKVADTLEDLMRVGMYIIPTPVEITPFSVVSFFFFFYKIEIL